MGFKAKAAAVFIGALLATGLAAAPSPASSVPAPTVTNSVTGATPIVAGDATGTTIEVAVASTDYNYEYSGPISGQVPPGLQIYSAGGTGLTCSTGVNTFSCSINGTVLPNNQPLVVTVKVRAFPMTAAGIYDFCAQMSWAATPFAPSSDPCPPLNAVTGDASDTTQLEVVRRAEMLVDAVYVPVDDLTDPGGQAQTRFTVTNNGPSLPEKLFLGGTLPPGLTFVSSEGTGWTCSVNGQDVSCEYVTDGCWAWRVCAPRAGGDRFTAIPPVTWTVGTAKPGRVKEYVVPVTVTGQDTPNTAGGRADALIPVTPVKLDVGKSVESKQYRVGEEMTWRIKVSNTGTIDDAGTITVTDTLSEALRFVSVTGDGWNCSHSGQKVTCDRPSGLVMGASSTISLKTKILTAGKLTNSAELSSTSYMSSESIIGSLVTVQARRAAQKAKPLPKTPNRIVAGRTAEGQKITTRVRCLPTRTGAAGEVRLCRVTEKAGVTRVRVLVDRPVKVIVVQTAPGTATYRPFARKKVYTVQP